MRPSSAYLSYLSAAVRARAAGHEVELYVGVVQAAVGELGGHPRQALQHHTCQTISRDMMDLLDKKNTFTKN